MSTTLIQIETPSTTPLANAATIDLTQYDEIICSTSGGKDSSVMLYHTCKLAAEQGVLDRVKAVQATFPEEWDGADAVAAEQCAQVGVPLTIVKNSVWPSLLSYVRNRKMWPSSATRYCTSEFKRAPIDVYLNHLPGHRKNGHCTSACVHGKGTRPQRILHVMGLRSQESRARRKRIAKQGILSVDKRRTGKGTTKVVHEWLPLAAVSEVDIWAAIREFNIPVHEAYSKGFTRLSCRICIYAERPTLLAAAHLHPELFKQYVDVENEIGHTFKADQSLAEVWSAKERGEQPEGELGNSDDEQ